MLEDFWSFAVNPRFVSSVALEWDWDICIYWPDWTEIWRIGVCVEDEQECYDNVVDRLSK